MHVVEILLPLRHGDGTQVSEAEFTRLRSLLTERFGGLTAFLRAPAEGTWRNAEVGDVDEDEIAVLEVMTETIDAGWWADFRKDLEERLGQKEIVIRSHLADRL